MFRTTLLAAALAASFGASAAVSPDEAKQLATEALRLQAVQAAQAEARWEEVKSSLDRIERDVRDMKARTN